MLRKRRKNSPSLVLGARGRGWGVGCHIHAFTTLSGTCATVAQRSAISRKSVKKRSENSASSVAKRMIRRD